MPTYDYRRARPDAPDYRSELDPTQYWPRPELDDVLILMPSYQGPSPRAVASIDAIVAAGAGAPVASFGHSDVAAHRNLVAARARTRLLAEPQYRYVLWLDDDMLATPSHVAALRAISQSPEVPDLCAITACYCKRGNPRMLAQRLVVDGVSVSVDVTQHLGAGVTAVEPVRVDMPEVVGGMGFLLVPRDLFLGHCQAVGDVGNIVHGAKSEGVPALCMSGPVRGEDGAMHWLPEDISYTGAITVLAAPLSVAHLSLVGLLPYPDATWL